MAKPAGGRKKYEYAPAPDAAAARAGPVPQSPATMTTSSRSSGAATPA